MISAVTPRRVLAGLALLLVLPTALSAVNRSRIQEVDGNATPPPTVVPVPAGSLADDEEFVAAVQERVEEKSPDADSISVRYVGDVKGRRLVLFLFTRDRQVFARYLAGTVGAPADQLTLSVRRAPAPDANLLTYAIPPDREGIVRQVAVSLVPECTLGRLGRPTVRADGTVVFEHVDLGSGSGAVVVERKRSARWYLDCPGGRHRGSPASLFAEGADRWMRQVRHSPAPTVAQSRLAMRDMRGEASVGVVRQSLAAVLDELGYQPDEVELRVLWALGEDAAVLVSQPDAGAVFGVCCGDYSSVAPLPRGDWRDRLIAWRDGSQLAALLPPEAARAVVMLGKGVLVEMEVEGALAEHDLLLGPDGPVREVIAYDSDGAVVDRAVPRPSLWAGLYD